MGTGTDNALAVLIVEDDSQDAELVCLELERGGFELDWSRVDNETELRAQLANPKWQLIISDFAMPTFNGLRAFEIYRELGLDTPFIFVSGALGEERAVAAMRAGARDYLLKGNLGRLNAAVRRELAEAANRRSLEESRRRAKREKTLLEAALAATNAGLVEFRVPENDALYVSERLAEMLGYRPEEVLAHSPVITWLFEQVHPLDLPALQEHFIPFLAGELPSMHSESRIRHRNGNWRHVSIYCIAVSSDEQGRVTLAVAVFLDITESMLLQERYLHSQKMEAVGKLAGGIAHDFNNLLTSIISFAGFVRDDLPVGDSSRDDIAEVLAASDRATALTRQLLLFSRRQPANFQPVSVGDAMTSIKHLLSRTIGEDLELVIELPAEPLIIRADQGQFDQIIMNLVVNARDAMPGGGSIRITAELVELGKGETSIPDLEPGAFVQISISDSGHGIDDQTMTRIFEPFFTTKGSHEGTGLGLATSYGITRQFGGVIEVESEVGVGTTFRVLLPQHAGASQPRASVVVANPTLRGTETILVVEDESTLRRIVERSLTALGYTVMLAEDAIIGLEIFNANREAIDMVFSDIVLTRGNGYEFAEHIRRQDATLPILLTSGYTDERIKLAETNLEILWKPYTPQSLGVRIRNCLARAQK